MADLFDLELELHDGGGPSRSTDAPDITRIHPRHQLHMHHHVHQDDSDDEDDEVIEVDNDMVRLIKITFSCIGYTVLKRSKYMKNLIFLEH